MNLMRRLLSQGIHKGKLQVKHFSVDNGSTFALFSFTTDSRAKNIKDVLNTMPDRKKKVVMMSATYPRASKVLVETDPKYVIFSGKFDGSAEDFKAVVNEATICHELNTFGIRESVIMTLDTIASSSDDFDLSSVQAVVIQRLGDHIVIIHNSRVSGDDRRVLLIALSDLRMAITAETTIDVIARIVDHRPKINWPAYAFATLGLVVVGAGQLAVLVKAFTG